MANALREWFPTTNVISTDIKSGYNFLNQDSAMGVDAIITNPPYSNALAFIEHAIDLMKPSRGKVAMLLRTDYDHAKSRRHLFHRLGPFAKKIALTKRIVWFEREGGASPSFNHAWYLWDWTHEGAPTIAYAPEDKEVDKSCFRRYADIPDFGYEQKEKEREEN